MMRVEETGHPSNIALICTFFAWDTKRLKTHRQARESLEGLVVLSFGARGAVEGRESGGGCGGTVRETRAVRARGECGRGTCSVGPCWATGHAMSALFGRNKGQSSRTDRAEGALSLTPFLVAFGCLTVDIEKVI